MSEQRPPAVSGGRDRVKIWGKNILGRDSSKHRGENEFGVFMGQWEGQHGWKHEWKIPSLGSLGHMAPTLPFSTVKLDRPQSDWRQPRGGMLTHIFLVNCSFGVRLIWLKGKGELEVLPLHLKGWLHRRGHSFGGCSLPTVPGAGCGDSLDACPAGHVELSLLPGQSRVPKYQKH